MTMAAFQMNMIQPNNLPGLCMNPAVNVIQARINPNSTQAVFLPGQAVVFSPTVVGQLPVVDYCPSGSSGRGVVIYDPILSSQLPNGVVLVAMLGSIVTMQAATAVNRQVNVGYNNVSGYVQSTSGGYIGYTLDIAVNVGDIVRVQIDPLLSA
jgi:hypothetical protein